MEVSNKCVQYLLYKTYKAINYDLKKEQTAQKRIFEKSQKTFSISGTNLNLKSKIGYEVEAENLD